MNIIRGAVAFLFVVGMAIVVGVGSELSGQATTPITCTDATTADQLCPEPCIIFADVYTKNNDSASVPGKTWVLPGQVVTWQGREDNDTHKKVTLKRVHFEQPNNAKKGKNGKPKLAEAQLDTATNTFKKKMNDGEPCVSYAYTVVVTHKSKNKDKDPEIEIATTTGPPTPPVQTTTRKH